MARLTDPVPAEEFLYTEGLISRRSIQQRIVLGCVGCQWLRPAADGEEPKFYGLQISRCTGIKTGTIYPILGRLADAGVMVPEREAVNPVEHLSPRVFYYPAAGELGEAFLNALQIPEQCSLPAEQ